MEKVKKRCLACNRVMDQLFFSISCGWCDFPLDPNTRLWSCYVVVDGYTVASKNVSSGFLFKYFKDALQFKEIFCTEDSEVWEASSFDWIDFRYPSGMPYQLSNALMTDGTHKIYHDHRFEQKDKEVFLKKRMD